MLKCLAFGLALVSAASVPVEAKKTVAKHDQSQLVAAVAKVDAFLSQFSSADIQMAIVHAGSQTPADVVAASCWNSVRMIVATRMPDAKLAYTMQRVRLFEANQKRINADCKQVLPKFLPVFNQAISVANK